MSLGIRVAIQYDPKGRGLRLAIGYARLLRRGTRDCYDIYGFLAGYCGGGCYDDGYFHVEQRRGQGYLNYTHSYGFVWYDEKIGSSGLDGKKIGREIEAILEAVSDRLFGRWLCWTDDGIIDLRESAQRRLSCDRKQAFWTSRGFDYDLLVFLSPKWPISLSFGEPPRRRRALSRARSKPTREQRHL